MRFTFLFRIALLWAAAFLAAAPAPLWADCSNPAGIKGEIVYNDDFDTMQFCDSVNWISMSASGTAVESDPQVDELTANRWCKANAGGTAIDCAAATVDATAAGSAGYVQFNAAGTLGADSALFWDNSTKRLGIGTASPGTALDVSGTVTATLFVGSGASLTGLNASNLGSGTIPDARFPATLPAISGENLTALNAGNLASGTVPDARFPATLPALSGANLTNLNASNLASGTLPGTRFPSVLPAVSGADLTDLSATALTSGTIPDARFPATLPAVSGANLTSLNAANLSSGTVPAARLGIGTANSSSFLRGDQSWAAIALAGLSDVSLSSPASNHILTYNGSAWTNAAAGSLVAGVAGPSFHVHKNGADQAFSPGGVQVTWPYEVFDTNNNFASNRFTPTVAGKYILTAGGVVNLGSANQQFLVSIRKNGVEIARGFDLQGATGDIAGNTTSVVSDANGTTDYFDVMVYTASASQTLNGAAYNTYFSGGMLAPLASGTVAGTGSAGYVPYWTSGNAITYDNTSGGQFFWDSTNHRLGIGTTAPSTLLHVAGNSTLGGTVAVTGAVTASSTITGSTGIGIGTSSIAASSVLDLVSTAKGFLPPRMTTAQRDAISSPATGLVVYNTTTNALNVRGASSWGAVGGGAIADASDTTITSPANNDVLQYSSGTSKWVNTPLVSAVAGAAGPSFSVHKNGTNQTVTTGTDTLLTWSTELFDTNNNFVSNRFTPTAAGKYLVTLRVFCSDSTAYCMAQINKNGAMYSYYHTHSNNDQFASVTSLIDMNGSSDYIEARGANFGGTTIVGATPYTSFEGAMLAPLASGTVAGTGSAGYLPIWTSGNAITYDSTASQMLMWDLTNHRLGIGTTAPSTLLHVVGNSTFGGTTAHTGAATFSSTITGATGVGIGTSSVNSKSILDLTSTTLGFLPPRMTTTQRDAISSPATGLMLYNTTTNQANIYNGTAWGAVGGGALSGLSDTTITSPANNDILQYSSGTSKWVNTPLVSAVAGAAGPSFFVALSGSQSIPNNTHTKVNWDTESFDTNNNFDIATNDRFTPTVAGKYILMASIRWTQSSTTGSKNCSIYKNGVAVLQTYAYEIVENPNVQCSGIVDANGTTDYFEVYAHQASDASKNMGGTPLNYFAGSLLAPLASGTVAGTGSAGYLPVWTSGNAITYDSTASQMLMWDLTNHRLGIGTTTPSTLLHVAGNSTLGGTVAVTGALTASSTLTGATGIGVGTSSVAASSALDVVSTTKGFLPPRMTEAQRDAISNPATGLVVYNTNTNKLNVRGASSWGEVGGGALSGLSDTTISSPTNNDILQYSSGTSKWVNTPLVSAVGGTAGPSFYVHKNSVDQAMSGATPIKITWSTEVFDSNNNFANDRFTPSVAGKYLIKASLHCQNATSYCFVSVYKNGSPYVYGFDRETQPVTDVTAIVDMNGSTDYVEIYAWGDGTPLAYGAAVYTSFQGSMLAPLASGTVAGTGNAGYLPVWTSGNAITYDSTASQMLMWDLTNHRLGIGTTTPSTLLHVAGNSTLGGTVAVTGALTASSTLTGATGIGVGTSSVAASSALDIVSTTKGFLPPRMTTAQRDAISSPATGLVVYNSTTNKLNVRGASAWGEVGGGALSGLSDVSLSSTASNDILRYSGSAWVNVPINTAMTTTTMQANWPDAIQCYGSTGYVYLYLKYGAAGGTQIYTTGFGFGGADLSVTFNSSGTMTAKNDPTVSWSGWYETNCNGGSGNSVTQLYAAGRAFNFIGTGAVTTFDVGTVAAPGLAVTSDTNTGFYQATADTLSITAGGIEAARFSTVASGQNYFSFTPSASTNTVTLASAGGGATVPITIDAKGTSAILMSDAVGIGTATPGAMLDVRETNTATSGNEYLNYSALTVTPGSASTAAFYGDHVVSTLTGTSDVTSLLGQSGYIYHSGSGIVTNAYGALNRVHNNSSGTITTSFGAYNDSQVLNTSTTTSAYGAYNRAYSSKASGTAASTAIGAYNISYNNGGGTITNSSGSQSFALNNAAGTITNAYGVFARVDNASTGTITTAYSLRADFVNDGGGAVTNWYGLSIPATAGVAATNEWPVYISHTGRNYFAGTIGVGTNNPAASSLVDLVSTSKGFLPPRMTTAQRDAISSPATGLVVYNTTTNALNVRGASAWGAVGGGAIADASDTTITSPANSDILQYSSGTSKWVNTPLISAVAGVAGPSFSVHKNGTNQTVSSGVATKLTWSTEDFDTNNNFASDRFTPTVAGKYLITASAYCTPAITYCQVLIYKNGLQYLSGFQYNNNGAIESANAVIDMDGSTDYVEAYVIVGGTVISGASLYTRFSGSMLAPLASGTVAGTGSAGYVPVWTSGNAITYDSTAAQMLMWDLTNHRLGIGTTVPSTLLHVAGNSTFGGTTVHTGAATFSSTIAGTTGVGIGTSSIAASSALDIVSTTKGFLPPRMTTAQRDAISSPATGLVVYNTTTNALNVRGASSWGAVGGGGALSALSDVTLSSPASGHVLAYNGSAWVNTTASTAMGTTTMVPNWPDAIICTIDGGSGYIFALAQSGGSSASYMYSNGAGTYAKVSFASAGANGSLSGSWTVTGCSTTISALYAAGNAFNFIGTGAVTTFNVGTAAAPGLAVTSDTNTGLWSSGADTLNISTGGSERLRIDSSGNVGIGIAPSSGFRLYVDGGGALHGMTGRSALNGGMGVIGYGDSTTSYGGLFQNSISTKYCYVGMHGVAISCSDTVSDVRLKKDITALETDEGLAAILQLRPVHYRWKDARLNEGQDTEIGFIAQEVEKVMPELVYEAPQGPNPAIKLPGNTSKALYYQRFVVPLVKAVQELKTLFDGLAVKMEKLIAEVTGHGEAIRKLEARVDTLTGENDALRRELNDLRKAFETFRAAPRADNDNAPAMPRAANDNEPIATKRMMKAAGMDAGSSFRPGQTPAADRGRHPRGNEAACLAQGREARLQLEGC